jgi:hypothetical protein
MQNSRCATDQAYSDELATVHIRVVKAIAASVDEKLPVRYDERRRLVFTCGDTRNRTDALCACGGARRGVGDQRKPRLANS